MPGAPFQMPMGMKYIFAMQWSRPRATKVAVGNQIAIIFEEISREEMEMKTEGCELFFFFLEWYFGKASIPAKQTSQFAVESQLSEVSRVVLGFLPPIPRSMI